MKKYTKEEVIQQIEKSCDIIYQCSETGDYKTSNKEAPKLKKIFKYFEKDVELAVECLKELLMNPSAVVSTKAAAYCLALNENVDEAVAVLEVNSERKDIGPFRMEAEMVLNIWKSRGYFTIYEGQTIRRYGPGDGLPFLR